MAEAGFWSGIGSGAAGILGALTAGYFGDRVNRMLLAAGAALLAAPPATPPSGYRPGDRRGDTLMMLAYGLLQMYYGPVYAAIQELWPRPARHRDGRLFPGHVPVRGRAGSAADGPLSDHLARRAADSGVLGAEAARAIGLHDAMYVMPALSLALAVILWAGSRAMPARRLSL